MKNKYFIALFLLAAAVVIFESLLKIMHFEIGPITGNLLLSIGMIAIIALIALFIVKLLTDRNNQFLNK